MRKSFCGWYFKCQSDTETLAVISASHGVGSSVQIITESGAWTFTENLGSCLFSEEGFCFDLHSDDASASANVRFGGLSPLRYDIMGPFRYVPFMQCRHSVVSMRHRVDGTVSINGKNYDFDNALGYIEGDRGRSFPSKYAWTQCFFENGSLMLSTADIPFSGFHFAGVIGVILLRGKEYRLATYLGAKAVKTGNGEVMIRQGEYTFSAKLLEKNEHPLSAPVRGDMVRTVRESVSCRAAYRFQKGSQTLLQFETDRASFEFEYGG